MGLEDRHPLRYQFSGGLSELIELHGLLSFHQDSLGDIPVLIAGSAMGVCSGVGCSYGTSCCIGLLAKTTWHVCLKPSVTTYPHTSTNIKSFGNQEYYCPFQRRLWGYVPCGAIDRLGFGIWGAISKASYCCNNTNFIMKVHQVSIEIRPDAFFSCPGKWGDV